ncbi:MAG: DUF6282 family protein [Candidatus Bathyarchaeia archaeon]
MNLDEVVEEALKPEYKKHARHAYTMIEKSAKMTFTDDMVNEFMQRIVEFHVHGAPKSLAGMVREWDEVQIAKRYCDEGAAAVVFKSHTFPSAARTLLVRNAVNDYAKQIGKDPPAIFGGITLNYYVGGLNPTAVRACVGFGGKFVWMPTHDSRIHRESTGESAERVSKGIYLLDKRNELLPEVKEILGIIADNDMVLCTGHIGSKERYVLVDEARKAGVKWIEITHPQFPNCRATVDQMVDWARMGAYIGLYWGTAVPNFYCNAVDPVEMKEIIERIGVDHIVGATDSGLVALPHPVEAMRTFIRTLIMIGIERTAIEAILKHNGAKILGLKE